MRFIYYNECYLKIIAVLRGKCENSHIFLIKTHLLLERNVKHR